MTEPRAAGADNLRHGRLKLRKLEVPASLHLPAAPPAGLGFTLAETLVTVGLVAVLLAIYTTLLSGTIFLRRSQYNTQAAEYIQEELDALHAIPFADLTNRSNGRFLAVPYQRGGWYVNSVADGQGKRLQMDSTPVALVEETGLALLPGNYRQNFTFGAKIKVDAASPAGWGAGIAFRYRDAGNHYRFRFSSGGIALDKVVQGTRTTIWSQSTTFNTGSWYTLEVVAQDNVLTLKKDGATLATVNDQTFLMGDLAIISVGGAKMSADNVSVTENAVTTSWDFESQALNSFPVDWKRLSWNDLPGGGGSLTIDSYLGEATMKQATVNITWQDAGRTRSASGTTVIY